MKYEMANKNVEKPKAETKEALRVMIAYGCIYGYTPLNPVHDGK